MRLQSELYFVELQLYIRYRGESVADRLIRLMCDYESLNRVLTLCQVFLHPAHVSQQLAYCLITSLVPLQLHHQPLRRSLVCSQKIDATDAARVLVASVRVAVLLIEISVMAKRDTVPVVPKKLVKMALQPKAESAQLVGFSLSE